MNVETTETIRNAALSLAALAVLALSAAAPARAQTTVDSPKWTVDGRAGVGIATGDLADLPIDDVGPTFGVGIGYYLSPRIAIRADGDLEIFSGEAAASPTNGAGEAPDLNLWHYNAGLEVELTRPGASAWDVTANVGGGATTMDAGDTETNFTANGGLKLGYDVSRAANVFVGGQWYLQFVDEEGDTTQDSSDTLSSIPLYAGLKLKL